MHTDATRLFEVERFCDECGEPFWGGPRARFCSGSCRSKHWRAKTAKARAVMLSEVCREVLRRADDGSGAYSKLLPRLFRQAAVELRRRGWDPFELLLSTPDEPATNEDLAPGGVTCQRGIRRRWLHAPERESELIRDRIAQRLAAGKSVEWHQRRLATLDRVLQERST
jgi:hypothetical protein